MPNNFLLFYSIIFDFYCSHLMFTGPLHQTHMYEMIFGYILLTNNISFFFTEENLSDLEEEQRKEEEQRMNRLREIIGIKTFSRVSDNVLTAVKIFENPFGLFSS